ncbi:MAG: PIG-L family deacetylase [Pirellulales bacterium]|nr:PIG-L family deacetylase [Pirellulales bacterium]
MNSSSPRRILAIGAHPDDVEFACAGTLARCRDRGDAVSLIVMCNGNSASSTMPAEELAAVRSRELNEAAKVLGAETVIELGLPDYGVWFDRETLLLLTDAIRRARPDVVITHFEADYGGDHNNTLQLARDATLAASVAGVKTAHSPIPKMPYLYMMEPLGGFGFQPQIYVDITSTIEVKIRMIECHRSQMEWMSRYGGLDSREYIRTVAKFRGYQAGVAYAEGFIAHGSFGHLPAGGVLP